MRFLFARLVFRNSLEKTNNRKKPARQDDKKGLAIGKNGQAGKAVSWQT